MVAKQENFRIKLLAGNNVVLVEADKYETEIFMPKIVNGRITFLNVIPNRRCCRISKTNIGEPKNNVTWQNLKCLKEQNEKQGSCDRLLGGQFTAPLANSTPAGVKERKSYGCMLSRSNSRVNSSNSTLMTPEPVRKAVPERPMFVKKSNLKLPKGVNVIRIYSNPTEDTPKEMGRPVTSRSKSSDSRDSAHGSILNGSFRLPCSPSVSSQNIISRTSAVDFRHSAALDSISNWQKVLTPIRTYTRNSKKPTAVRRTVSESCAKKTQKSSKYKPTYLVNPTQGPNVTQEIEVQKRKLIIDGKIRISPKSFKEQQNETHTNLTAARPSCLSFHKPRSYLQTMGMSAFDLLTNSNRSHMAGKLNEQFRKGCVNKASSTYSKYKSISTVPTIQKDEQVLEMSRILLQK